MKTIYRRADHFTDTRQSIASNRSQQPGAEWYQHDPVIAIPHPVHSLFTARHRTAVWMTSCLRALTFWHRPTSTGVRPLRMMIYGEWTKSEAVGLDISHERMAHLATHIVAAACVSKASPQDSRFSKARRIQGIPAALPR
jgi:hypothetical protein